MTKLINYSYELLPKRPGEKGRSITVEHDNETDIVTYIFKLNLAGRGYVDIVSKEVRENRNKTTLANIVKHSILDPEKSIVSLLCSTMCVELDAYEYWRSERDKILEAGVEITKLGKN